MINVFILFNSLYRNVHYCRKHIFLLKANKTIHKYLLIIYSHLRGLVPSFNSCVDIMVNKLRPLADGKTEVPMKDILSSTTLEVISKVSKIIITALIIPLLTLACVGGLEGYCNHSVCLSVCWQKSSEHMKISTLKQTLHVYTRYTCILHDYSQKKWIQVYT